MPKKLKDFLLRHWGCVLASLPSEVPSFPLGLGEQYSQNARATTGLSSCSPCGMPYLCIIPRDPKAKG